MGQTLVEYYESILSIKCTEYQAKYGQTPKKFYVTMPVYGVLQAACLDTNCVRLTDKDESMILTWQGIPIERILSEDIFVVAAGESIELESIDPNKIAINELGECFKHVVSRDIQPYIAMAKGKLQDVTVSQCHNPMTDAVFYNIHVEVRRKGK